MSLKSVTLYTMDFVGFLNKHDRKSPNILVTFILHRSQSPHPVIINVLVFVGTHWIFILYTSFDSYESVTDRNPRGSLSLV